MQIECKQCGRLMPQERLDVGLDKCSCCTDQSIPVAFNVFNCKTNPELVLVRGEENIRQATNANIRKR